MHAGQYAALASLAPETPLRRKHNADEDTTSSGQYSKDDTSFSQDEQGTPRSTGRTSRRKFNQIRTLSTTKKKWTEEEEDMLRQLVEQSKQGGLDKSQSFWKSIARHLKGRTARQVRERWENHVRPGIVKGQAWTYGEELCVISLHSTQGNCWSAMAQQLPERSANAIKNHWNNIHRQVAKAQCSHDKVESIPAGSELLWEYTTLLRQGLHPEDAKERAVANVPQHTASSRPAGRPGSGSQPLSQPADGVGSPRQGRRACLDLAHGKVKPIQPVGGGTAWEAGLSSPRKSGRFWGPQEEERNNRTLVGDASDGESLSTDSSEPQDTPPCDEVSSRDSDAPATPAATKSTADRPAARSKPAAAPATALPPPQQSGFSKHLPRGRTDLHSLTSMRLNPLARISTAAREFPPAAAGGGREEQPAADEPSGVATRKSNRPRHATFRLTPQKRDSPGRPAGPQECAPSAAADVVAAKRASTGLSPRVGSGERECAAGQRRTQPDLSARAGPAMAAPADCRSPRAPTRAPTQPLSPQAAMACHFAASRTGSGPLLPTSGVGGVRTVPHVVPPSQPSPSARILTLPGGPSYSIGEILANSSFGGAPPLPPVRPSMPAVAPPRFSGRPPLSPRYSAPRGMTHPGVASSPQQSPAAAWGSGPAAAPVQCGSGPSLAGSWQSGLPQLGGGVWQQQGIVDRSGVLGMELPAISVRPEALEDLALSPMEELLAPDVPFGSQGPPTTPRSTAHFHGGPADGCMDMLCASPAHSLTLPALSPLPSFTPKGLFPAPEAPQIFKPEDAKLLGQALACGAGGWNLAGVQAAGPAGLGGLLDMGLGFPNPPGLKPDPDEGMGSSYLGLNPGAGAGGEGCDFELFCAFFDEEAQNVQELGRRLEEDSARNTSLFLSLNNIR